MTNPDPAKRWAKRNSNLKHRYGITAHDVDQMIQEQGGRCAICNEVPKKGLVVDHSHTSKKVRGLICHGCNVAAGFLRDNPIIVYQCALYLERHRDDNDRSGNSKEDRR